MSFALSLAWRLLLALALVASPMLGMAADGGCADGTATRAHVAHAAAMPGCTHMADMAPKAPQGKHDSSPARPAGHGGCASHACCLGGAVGMAGPAFVLATLAPQATRADFHDAPAPTPPASRMLRPPIA